MKKFIIWFIVIFCIQLLTAKTITQTYNFEIPELILKDGFTELNYQNCRNFGEEGYPSFPYLAADILLPQNQELEKVRIISSEYYPVQKGIMIKPASKQFPISSGKHLDYKVIPNEDIYNSSKSFPENIVDNTGTNFLCGHSIASFTICPISYLPSESQIEFLKSITIEIITNETSKALSAERFLQNSLKIERRIHNIVENPETLNQYTYSQQSRDVEEDILIITNNTLSPAFADYIDFKESTGFIVETVTTEYIDVTYTGTDLQEKIRNCIIDHYTNNGISYVILGGDSDTNDASDIIVPHRGMSAANDPTIPSDMYFAGLDGNWDNDGDGIWGETNEWDLYAELSIGRICVDSATEILNFTHKLEMYQNSPVVADIEKALMLGEELNDSPLTNGGTSKNEIITGGSFNGYTTSGIDGNFTVSTLYQMDTNWDKYDVFSQFNTTGVNLLNHLGHSSPTFNMNIDNYNLTTANFQNDGITRGYVIGYSQGCYSGSFDNWHYDGYYLSGDSFAEDITTLETAEVAIIANSRYGFYEPGSTNSSSQYYDRQFYDAIFGQNITCIGEANRYSKEKDVSRIQSDQIMRWSAYELNLFGDPSMDIWTNVPVAMNVSYPPGVLLGMNSISFTTDTPYARIGLIQNGVMIGRAVAGVSGDVTVNLFTPIDDTNDITVSIIAHNKIRHQGTIVVVFNQAYVIYNSHVINDPSGNNNGVADYGESVTLDMILENVGDHNALNVNAILSTIDSYISVTDNTQSYGTISQSNTSTQNNAFAFAIADNIPDQHVVNFDLEITGTSARDTWDSTFQIAVNAPELTIDNMIIDDSTENNNGRLDSGETVVLIFPTNNDGHSNLPTAIGTLSCTSGYITINGSNTHVFGVIDASSTENAVFNITVASNAPFGTNISFDYDVTSGNYGVDETFNRMIGLIVEDFETADFASYSWEDGGSASWTVVTESPYERTYCAKSGTITHSQTSELILTANVAANGTISFYRKVSSESGYDYLKFFIDDVGQGSWSGTADWSEVSYPVTAGNRTFKWQYYKDSGVSNGSDCAWIDYINFPELGAPHPVFDLALTSIDFGNVAIGTISSKQFTIFNSGGATLTGNITTPTGYSIAAADNILFTSQVTKEDNNSDNTISYTIPAISNQTFYLVFSPLAATTYNSNVAITSNDIYNPTNNLNVIGVGYVPAEITVTPLSLEKTLLPENSTSDVLTIGNSGGVTLDYTATVSFVTLNTISNTNDVEINNSNTEIVSFAGKKAPIQYDHSNYPTPRQGGDTVGSATVINSLPYNNTGTTVGYTDDYDEECTYTGSTSPDVVYSYTPANTMINCTVTTCNNASYDTKLYIYENTITSGSPFACNDDHSGCSGYTSQLDGLTFTTGNTYYIVVDGYGGQSGDYGIEITGDVVLTWLTLDGLNEVTGSINSGSTDDVISIGFDDTGLEVGVYEANIIIISNDPNEATITVPVTLTVSGHPDPPINIQISNIGMEITISWDAVTGATSYTVYRSSDPYAIFPSEWTSETGITGTTWIYTTDRMLRFYRVTANN